MAGSAGLARCAASRVARGWQFAALALAVALGRVPRSAAHNGLEAHVAAQWDFEGGLDGWAQSTWEELGAQVVVEDGELRGRRVKDGSVPHFDSPLMKLKVDDRYVVGLRIKVAAGHESLGAVQVRMREPATLDMDFQALDVAFGGGNDPVVTVPFDRAVPSDGRFHLVYAHIHAELQGTITQLRILPLSASPTSTAQAWSAFEVDWIQLVKMPTINKVEGCINKYFSSEAPRPERDARELRPDGHFAHRGGHENGTNAAELVALWANEDRHLHFRTEFETSNDEAGFATTFNCPREGLGYRLRISGRNFGAYTALPDSAAWDTVWVDGEPCTDVRVVVPQQVLMCTLPRATTTSGLDRVTVRVAQPDHRDLWDDKPYLSYVVPPPQMPPPRPGNIGSRALDLSWDAPENRWDAVTVTGYRVWVRERARLPSHPAVDSAPVAWTSWPEGIVVGNVTSTTVTQLSPAREYRFAIEALAEDQRNAQWTAIDLYGRRLAVPGAVASVRSNETVVVSTLGHDVHFARFDANSTLDHGAVDARTMQGPSRNEHGEGHYGLRTVGDAHIANCNTSASCCDFEGPGPTCRLLCTGVAPTAADYVNLVSSREVRSNDPSAGGGTLSVGVPATAAEGAGLPACGGALRLTSSGPRQAGAAWYPRKMNVREGFVADFTFQLANPSLVCKYMDDVATHCRSRGADGLAFVVQNAGPLAVGGGAGAGLGFAGIPNAVAVEFDTFHNPEQVDPFENHVALFVTGIGRAANASHAFELGGSAAVQDLTDGPVRVKIVYSPHLDEDLLFTDAFAPRSHAAWFMTGHDAGAEAGQPEYTHNSLGADVRDSLMPRAWGEGLGSLSVFVQDMGRPLFTAPLNLGASMALDSGRAFVGFTAATGDSFWQSHEILRWSFDAARESSRARP